MDYIHDSIIYPRCVALETLEAPLEEDEAEEVRRGAGHQREGDGGHVGEGGLAGGHQVEHAAQTLTYQLFHKDRASVNKSIYRKRVICSIHVQIQMTTEAASTISYLNYDITVPSKYLKVYL